LYELPADQPSEQWAAQRDLYEQAVSLYEQDRPAECLEIVEQLIARFGSQDVPTIRLQLRAQTRLAQPQTEFDPVMSVETK
jgi:hypothetical protein